MVPSRSCAAGLNDRAFDALVVLAAGAWEPTAIAKDHELVRELQTDMDNGRRRRLARLGFSSSDSAELAAFHTRNFMWCGAG